MDDSIRLPRYFVAEEISLMGRCLEAIVSGRFIDNQMLQTLTGRNVETFQELSGRFESFAKFDTTARLSRDDYEVIFQAVLQLVGYPVDNPRDLGPFLGISVLHLNWFRYRLTSMRDDWKQTVEADAKRLADCELSRVSARDRR